MISNTEVVPPGMEKFKRPHFPTFGGIAPWYSVASLLGFFVASVMGIWWLSDQPRTIRFPLYCTAVGSGLGFLFELWLIASGRPYQLFMSKGGRFIQSMRSTNYGVCFWRVIFCLPSFCLRFRSSTMVDLFGRWSSDRRFTCRPSFPSSQINSKLNFSVWFSFSNCTCRFCRH